jgi:methanogenesis marker radical SAM protein
MEIMAHVGGKPGKDCGGFCEFCFFKTVDFKELESLKLGCRYCPPHQIGCNHCHEIIETVKTDFKTPNNVLMDLEKVLFKQRVLGILDDENPMITVFSTADIISYPHLPQLLSELKEREMLVHLGYTSGKGFKNEKMAEDIVSIGIDEISFTVFSTDPEKRRKWMKDKTPEESLKALKIFCENINVNASTVVIPGVIDQEDLFQTCSTMEDWGVKTFNLSNFANLKIQGLILNKKPVIEGITPHSQEEFQELVQKVVDEFNFRIGGSPHFEPKMDLPFAISQTKNRKYLENLPPITAEATILTSKLAAPYLKKIFEVMDKDHLVNIVNVEKEIADLIVPEDLALLNLHKLKNRIIIPADALVQDKQAEKILSKDGSQRSVIRGPKILSPTWDLNKKEILNFEFNAFKELINTINMV